MLNALVVLLCALTAPSCNLMGNKWPTQLRDSSWVHPPKMEVKAACTQPGMHVKTTCNQGCTWQQHAVSGNSTSFSFTEPPLKGKLNLLHRTSPYMRITTSLYRTTHYNHSLSLQAFFWSHKVPKHAECMTNCTVTAETKSKRFMRLALVD